MDIINYCFIENDLKTIVNYSHIIPVILSLFLGFLVLFKAKFSYSSKIFLAFIIMFCLWLIGDLITWNSNNYNLIYATWSVLPFLEILFYITGIYFGIISYKKTDISIFSKLILILIIIPPLFITLTGKSVMGFSQPICEAYNNNFLDIYKLVVEIILLLILFYYTIKPFFYKISSKIKKINFIVLGSMFLFLAVFGGTEYYAAITGIYEYNLYSLFLLPIFLLVIIYSIFELDFFNFEVLGTQYLVVGLVVLMVGQLFFVNGNTDRLLTTVTVIITVALSIILFKNFKKETDQRLKIEDLSMQLESYNLKLKTANEKLKGLDKLKTEFVSLASHQLRSPLTAIKGYASMILDGDYGDTNKDVKEKVERILESSNNLTLVVEDFLNVAKIEQGGMKYEMIRFDFGELVENTVKDLSIAVEKRNLRFIYKDIENNKYFVNGDKEKLRQVIINLLDNSMKYTPQGQIEVNLKLNNNKILLSINDTGVGIPEEIIGTLFDKFARGEGAKLNTSGSGLGLYLVKEIIEAHKGRVWVESEGRNKGSTFFVEMTQVE